MNSKGQAQIADSVIFPIVFIVVLSTIAYYDWNIWISLGILIPIVILIIYVIVAPRIKKGKKDENKGNI